MSGKILWAFLWAALVAAPVSSRAFGGAAVAPEDFQRFSVTTPAGPDEPEPALFLKLKPRLIWAEHRITRKDESVSLVAKEFGTTVNSLQITNNDGLFGLFPGRRITVLNYGGSGQLYQVTRDSETLNHIVARFVNGKADTLRFREAMVIANKLPGIALLEDYEFERGARVLVPNVRLSFDAYRFPVEGLIRISSGFGMRFHPLLHRTRMHDGFDIAKPWGTPVYPAYSGRVIQTGWTEGYGLLIVIKHPDGYTTRYGHLSKIFVHAGQSVQRGTMIGHVGSTGLSTGPHLHFEVRDPSGHPINPKRKVGRIIGKHAVVIRSR